jgi:hypothetical protein
MQIVKRALSFITIITLLVTLTTSFLPIAKASSCGNPDCNGSHYGYVLQNFETVTVTSIPYCWKSRTNNVTTIYCSNGAIFSVNKSYGVWGPVTCTA